MILIVASYYYKRPLTVGNFMKLLFALRNCGIVEGKEESVIMSNSKKTPNARQTVVQRILL